MFTKPIGFFNSGGDVLVGHGYFGGGGSYYATTDKYGFLDDIVTSSTSLGVGRIGLAGTGNYEIGIFAGGIYRSKFQLYR